MPDLRPLLPRDRLAGDLTWLQVQLPIPTVPEAAIDAVQALAGLSHHPRLVLEARGSAGQVTWWLGCRRSDIRRVLAAIRAHVPGLLATTSPDDEDIDGDTTVATEGAPMAIPLVATKGARAEAPTTHLAKRLRIRGHREQQLDVDRIEPVTRRLLTALGMARTGETLRLQLILGPHDGPRIAHATQFPEYTDLARAQGKYDHHRFACVVRIGVDLPAAGTTWRSVRTSATGSAGHRAEGQAQAEARARRLIEGVISALRGLEVPGIRLTLRREKPRKLHKARTPFWWSLELTTAEVAALLAWPLSNDARTDLPSVAPTHPRLLPTSPRIAKAGRVLGDAAAPVRPVATKPVDALRHAHVVGPPGTGKSTLLANLALQDIETGHGVVVVDPKQDLVSDLLARIPEHRRDDVVVLDPLADQVIGLQALGGRTLEEADLSAEVMLGIIKGLYPDAFGPMTADVLHAALVTLARRGKSTLAMVPSLLANPAFRRTVVGPVRQADPLGVGGFWASFEALSEPQKQQTIAPLLRRLRPILMRPGLRAVFGQSEPRFSLADVFTKKRILLVPLSKGTLGPEAASLLGSVLIGLLWQTALGRSALSPTQRHPVHVIVDEFVDVLRLGTDLGDALAQARGLGVSFTIAQQHLSQAPKQLREAVAANTQTKVMFALSDADSREMAATTPLLDTDDFRSLPAHHAYARILADGTTAPWCSIRTRPLPPALHDGHALRRSSSQRYGRARQEIDAELIALTTPPKPSDTADRVNRIGRRRTTPDTSGSGDPSDAADAEGRADEAAEPGVFGPSAAESPPAIPRASALAHQRPTSTTSTNHPPKGGQP